MGNEMGNNNTTPALKEGDNTSEAERKTLLEENQIAPAAKGKEADTKADGLASNDTIELGNETLKGDSNGDGIKGESQTITTSKAKDVTEEAAETSDDATIELGKDTLEEDSHADADDVKGQNQTTTAEAENIEEQVAGLPSVESTSMLQNDSLQRDTHGDEVIVENQIPPTAEAEGAQDNATSLASNNITNALGNGSLEGDTCEDDVNADHQKHPSSEVKFVPEEAAMIDVDDKICEAPKGKSQKYTHENGQGENAINPISEDIDDQGKSISLSFDDQSNVEDSSLPPAVQEETEISRAEISPNARLVETEGDNCKILSSSLLEGTEEYEKQEDLCLKKNLLVTYDLHVDHEPSIKPEEENTTVLMSDTMGITNDAELQESSDVHSNHNEIDKVLNEPSLQGSESLQESNNLDTNPLCSLDKDDISEKEVEIKKKILCAAKTDGGDGDEFGSSVKHASEITDDSPSIGEKSHDSLLAKVNHITDHSMNSLPESDVVYMLVYEERKLSRSGSKMENLHECNPGQCWEEPLKELKADMTNTNCMTIRSNGDCKGEGKIVLDSSLSGISDTDQAEEPKITEYGHQFDVCINNHNTSDEISTASVQEDFMVPEAEADGLIPGATFVNCRHEKEEHNKEKVVEEIDKAPEASQATVKSLEGEDMSEQFNSHLLALDQKESLALQTFASLLHILDWKKENDSKSLGAIANNLDSSNLTVPALDLVDEEALEKEGKDYSQQAEATSLKEAEAAISEANLPSVPFLNDSIFANGGYEAMESITRSSTESNSDHPNISGLIQKSPSFNLNLPIQARPEESDQIPLLHQSKTAIESLPNQTSLNLINSMPHAEFEPCILQHEEVLVEEKIVTMERSYSEKFKAPFLGLLKEEEEAHLLVMPKKQDNHARTLKGTKELPSASPKGKEKRKLRPSFFSSCMCCATVTN